MLKGETFQSSSEFHELTHVHLVYGVSSPFELFDNLLGLVVHDYIVIEGDAIQGELSDVFQIDFQ